MTASDDPGQSTPLVGVVLEGREDFNMVRGALETLRIAGVPYLLEVVAAHREPARLAEFASTAAHRGMKVLVCAATPGSTAPALAAAHTDLPVIALPLDWTGGPDPAGAFATAPAGAPLAVVGTNQAENAALLAIQILALLRPAYGSVLALGRAQASQRADALAAELRAEHPELAEPARTAAGAPLAAAEQDTEPGLGEDFRASRREMSERIRPGAVSPLRAGRAASRLVSTPVPHEPVEGAPRPPGRATLQSILGGARPASATPVPRGDDPADADTSDPAIPLRPDEADTLDPSVPDTPSSFKTPTNYEDAADGAADPEGAEDEPVETKIFTVDPEDPQPDILDHAMLVVLEGGVLALPTDTVYGLAADATSRPAVERLYRVRGREHQRTMGVLISHPDMLIRLVREVPPALEKVLEECWPGPLTVILPKHPGTLASVTPSDRIGVRIPDDVVCLRVLERVGRPLAVRNASLSASRPMVDPDAVVEAYSGHVDCILQAGLLDSGGAASSVLNATVHPFELLREGGIPRAQLEELLGEHLAPPT